MSRPVSVVMQCLHVLVRIESFFLHKTRSSSRYDTARLHTGSICVTARALLPRRDACNIFAETSRWAALGLVELQLKAFDGKLKASAMAENTVAFGLPLNDFAHGARGDRVAEDATRRCMQYLVQHDFDRAGMAPGG
jgi:hypothetical protein